MATYTDPTTLNIAHKKFVTVQLVQAGFDNPIAIARGETGAPRIVGEAIADENTLDLQTVTASDDYDTLPGHGIVDGDLDTTSTSYVTAYTNTVGAVTGTVRYKASHAVETATGSPVSRLGIFKNGTIITSWTSGSTTLIERSADVAVVPGDVITWQHRISSGAGTSQVRNQTATATSGWISVTPYKAVP